MITVFEVTGSRDSCGLSPIGEASTPTGPIALALGDLDGDNKLDAVVANHEGNSLSIFSDIAE